MNTRRGPLTVLVLALALAGCVSASSNPAAAPGGAPTSPSLVDGGDTLSAADLAATRSPSAGGAPTDAPKSSPAPGSNSTALLHAAWVERSAGIDRIVFQFTGAATPGYRVRWVPGPITTDGSGQPVVVKGRALLEIILDPASGVDMATGKPTYVGPDRVAIGRAHLLTDLRRTGDFEGVLTWVVGAQRRVPFRVGLLQAPARLVVDLLTSP
ncbi:MAG: uncharacterized protein JWN46_2594 [Acidimicrobiales bacterium]|nr:uncharacterized protein [Acidimicrobiales bacterium]